MEEHENSVVETNKKISPFYWIHCNSCYELHIRKRKRIFLLSCHHLACDDCANKHLVNISQSHMSTFKCPVCGKIARGRQLTNVMPQHIKELFHPTYWRDDVFNFKIFNFQTKHRTKFMKGFVLPFYKHFERLQEKQLFLKKRVKHTVEQFEALRLKRKQLEARARRVIAERAERTERPKSNSSLISSTTFSHPQAHSTLVNFKNSTAISKSQREGNTFMSEMNKQMKFSSFSSFSNSNFNLV